MQFRLFNKPAAFQIAAGTSRMWIDGMYPDYSPGAAYEGRVKIHGSVGLMRLTVVASNIPPGASVYVDQLTKEVVVKWPLYSPPVAYVRGVPNGNFEDDSYWEVIGAGTPITRETNWSPNGKGNLTYRNRKGEYIVRGAWAPAGGVNQKLTITGKVEHGKSSKGNASCAVGLAWYDKDRNLVREDWGNAISNGGGGRWYDSKLDGYKSDTKIAFVRPAIKFTRKKQNEPIHVAQIEWDHVYEEGYNSDEQLFVEVKVTDSVQNVATHRGIIDEENLWVTSQPAALFTVDSYGLPLASFGATGLWSMLPDHYSLSATLISASVSGGESSSYAIPPENYRVNPASLLSAATKVEVQYSTYASKPENYRVGPASIVSAATVVQNYIRNVAPESYQLTAQFISGGTQ